MTPAIKIGKAPADDISEGLPEGWTLTTLRDACEINPPKAPKDSLPAVTPVTFVPMPAVDADEGAITTPLTRKFSEVRKGFTSFRENDVIMAKITPCMENGKAAIARNLINGLGFGSTEFHVFRSTGATLPEFVYHYVRQESYRRSAEAEMTGSVGQKRVPQAFLETTELPLPPMPEQVRIVKSLTELLNTVKASRDKLSRIPATLKRFRQALLAAACSGRLTEDWRNAHGGAGEDGTALAKRVLETKSSVKSDRGRLQRVLRSIDDDDKPWELPDTWTYTRLGNLCSQIADIDHKMPKSVPEGVKFISAKDLLDDGTLNLTREVKLISEADYVRLSRKAKPRRNDIIYSRIGARLGKARLVETDERFLVSYSCCIVRPLIINPRYLMGYLDSGVVLAKAREQARSIGVPDLGLDEITHFVVPLPPLAEQEQIVTRLDILLAFASRVEQNVTLAAQHCEKLTQSILAKAFRGELVPTEAELARREGQEYEPASVLLERIKKERENQVKSPQVSKHKSKKSNTLVGA